MIVAFLVVFYLQDMVNFLQKNMKPAFVPARGFTLIELLVVIAIIGILASIVLVALGNVKNRGANAGVGSNLAGMRTRGELFAQANNYSYDGYCTNSVSQHGGKRPVDAAVTASGIVNQTVIDDTAIGASLRATCHDASNAWAVEVPLATPNTQFWCADSNGFSGTTTISTLTLLTDTQCN